MPSPDPIRSHNGGMPRRGVKRRRGLFPPRIARVVWIVTAGLAAASLTLGLIGSQMAEGKARTLIGVLALTCTAFAFVPLIFIGEQITDREDIALTAAWGAVAGVTAQLLWFGGPGWLETPLGALCGAGLGLMAWLRGQGGRPWRERR